MTEVLTLLPTNTSNTYHYAPSKRQRAFSIEQTHDSIENLQNTFAGSHYKAQRDLELDHKEQHQPLLDTIPICLSASSSSSSLATVIFQEAADKLADSDMSAPVYDQAQDRQQAAGSPLNAASSSAPAPPVAQTNGKAKQAEYATQFVHLPNVAPRSYTILKEVGDGSFGTVWLADWHSPLELPPGTAPPGPSSRPEYKGKKLVAIKRMKKAFEGGWDECMQLKELKSLMTIPSHPYIIPLYDAFLLPTTKELYFVFECMEGNLYQLTKSRRGRPLANGLIVSIFYQMILGLHHVHSSGFFHRDMKPENLLITTTGLADYPASSLFALPDAPTEKDVMCIVKLADFGLARETESKPPYTEYVSTRWYRAPEVLLRSRDYSGPVDMWALGTILAEMVNLKPLFPGQSEVDQVLKIAEVLGDPMVDYGVDSRGRTRGGGMWEKGVKMAKSVHFNWPKIPPVSFSSLFDPRMAPPQLIDCIHGLLQYDPARRLATSQCIEHEYFSLVPPRFAPVPPPGEETMPNCPYPYLTSYSSDQHMQTLEQPSYPSQDMHLAAARHQDRHASLTHSVQSMPESVRSEMAYGWDPRQMQPTLQPPNRNSTAASSIEYYDGSVFEGNSSSREASLRSFATDPESIRNMPPPSFAGNHRSVYDDNMSAQLEQQRRQGQPTQIHPQAPAPSKSSRWLSSVFNSSDSAKSSSNLSQHSFSGHPPAQTIHQSTSSLSLKRSPSQRSTHQPAADNSPPAFSSDPKKAKKEAEKAAKEAEKAKREAAQQAARERARAVMQKRSQLNSQADYWGAHPNTQIRAQEQAAALKGKQRTAAVSPLPNISESRQLRPPDNRAKARRRDDDDDVHSVSSNETRNSSERRYSFQSYNTMESDPGPSRPAWSTQSNSRTATASSYGSFGSIPNSGRRPGLLGQVHDRPPGSSSSSVDGQLARNFQGLSAADGHWTSYDQSAENGQQQFKLFTSASFQQPQIASDPYSAMPQSDPYAAHSRANYVAASFRSSPADLSSSDNRSALSLPFLPQMLSNVPPSQDAGSPALYKLSSDARYSPLSDSGRGQ